MTKAIVIKMIGDADMGNAIIDGMTQQIIPINGEEMAIVQAEIERLRAETAVRAYGDRKRLVRARREMAMKYSTKPAKPILGAVLGLYGLLCYMVAICYNYLAEWNRS